MRGFRNGRAAVLIVGIATIFTISEGPAMADPLTIGAPPSLKGALTKILPMFEQEQGAAVQVVYQPSKTLRQQIEQGAAIDVFLAAGTADVEHLRGKGLLLNGGHRIYAQTSLVLVMPSDSPTTLVSFHDALPNRATRIALGDPRTSSLGEVTDQMLTKLGPAYRRHAHVLYAPHSGDIMQLLQTGKADVGLVYRIDTIHNGQVRISDETPLGTYVPVQFGQAVVSTCREGLRPVAERFSDFLMSPRIQKLLLQHGFEPVSAHG